LQRNSIVDVFSDAILMNLIKSIPTNYNSHEIS